MQLYQDAKKAIITLKKGDKKLAKELLINLQNKYPNNYFFKDIYALKLDSAQSEAEEVSSKMSNFRRALFYAYHNAEVISFAIETKNNELRVGARNSANDWMQSILTPKKSKHPDYILAQGFIYYCDREPNKTVDTLKQLSSNSRYWPLALRIICCCSIGDAPHMPELHQYYKELIATDLTTTIFLASYACDESKIDAIAKINCAIYLGNVQHNNDIFYKNQYEALAILDLIPERYRGAEYFSTIGGQLININKLDDAKAALKASISLCETPGALASLASVHNRLDDNEQALTLADRALTISPNHFSARAIKGIVLCCLGRHAEAIPLLAHAVREQPLYPPTIESLGKSLIASGEVMVDFASLLRTGNFDHENRALELIELLAELLVD